METSLSEGRGLHHHRDRIRIAEGPMANAMLWARMAVRWLAKPMIWQPLLAGAVATAIGLAVTGGSFAETGWWPIVVGLGAGSMVFSYLQRVLGLSAWFSVPAAAFFLSHPLVRMVESNQAGGAMILGILIVPLTLLLAERWGEALSLRRVLCQGGLLGLAAAIDLPGGVLLTLVLIAFGILEMMQLRTVGREGDPIRRWATMFALILVVALVLCVVLPGVTESLGLPLQGETEISAEASVAVSSPLAVVDRGGLLSARLSNLPEELVQGQQYLGWSIIFLCLIAVWPGASSSDEDVDLSGGQSRRIGLLLLLVIAMTWLCRGSAEGVITGTGAIGSQLKDLFEFATVRRYVDSENLNYLGFLIIPLVAVVVTLFLATASVFRGKRGFTFIGVIAAAFVVLCFWRTCPPEFLQHCADGYVGGWGGSPLLNTMLAFALVASAAVGLRRLCELAKSWPWRSLLWVGLLVILAVDMSPIAGNTARSDLHQSKEITQVEGG